MIINEKDELRLHFFDKAISVYEDYKEKIPKERLKDLFSGLSFFLSGVKGFSYNEMLLLDLFEQFNDYIISVVDAKEYLRKFYNESNADEDIEKHWLVNKSIYVCKEHIQIKRIINEKVPMNLVIEVFNDKELSKKIKVIETERPQEAIDKQTTLEKIKDMAKDILENRENAI